MSTVTYELVSPETGRTPVVAPLARRKGLFARLFASLMEARRRQAMNEMRRLHFLLPHELEQHAAWKITERSEDSLPFLR